jgi:hypothetical protein
VLRLPGHAEVWVDPSLNRRYWDSPPAAGWFGREVTFAKGPQPTLSHPRCHEEAVRVPGASAQERHHPRDL